MYEKLLAERILDTGKRAQTDRREFVAKKKLLDIVNTVLSNGAAVAETN
jgi:hypothetical protein